MQIRCWKIVFQQSSDFSFICLHYFASAHPRSGHQDHWEVFSALDCVDASNVPAAMGSLQKRKFTKMQVFLQFLIMDLFVCV